MKLSSHTLTPFPTTPNTTLLRSMFWATLLAAAWMVLPLLSRAVTVAPEELDEATRWTAAKLRGALERQPLQPPALVVLANNDPVQKNARAGRPMRIVNTEFTHGLYCHAVSRIIVRLPGPGDIFTAGAGVDSNEQTSGGRGSVRFAVLVNGTEAFRSGVMREGMAAVPVRVNLAGASEFILQIDDAGDGIGCDQSDWADAKVKLNDGRELWLADLPLQEGPGRPRTPLSRRSRSSMMARPSRIWGGPPPGPLASLIPAAPNTRWSTPTTRPGSRSGASPSNTTTSPRLNGRSTSRTTARKRRRSCRKSNPSTPGSTSARATRFFTITSAVPACRRIFSRSKRCLSQAHPNASRPLAAGRATATSLTSTLPDLAKA